MVDIHLVSWNRPKMTELVIKTLAKNTKRDNYRLAVLDNGSDKETVEMLNRLHDDGLIDELRLIPYNEGLEWARQALLRGSTYDDTEFLVCLDNDCLAPPMKDGQDWLEQMVELMERYEDFAAISMRTEPMIGTGNIFEEADKVGDDIVEFAHPGGSFRIMRTNAVREVGGWDRGAEGRGSEETYICGKLRDAGYRTAFAVKLRCLHLYGTRGDNGTDRWGYDKDFQPEDTGHRDVFHPKLQQGDDIEEVSLYAGEELANAYRNY